MAKKGGKSSFVGSSYSEDRYVVPWNAAVDSGTFGNKKGKTIDSPAESTFEPALKIHNGYDKLWEK
jgi:hypothetical protein